MKGNRRHKQGSSSSLAHSAKPNRRAFSTLAFAFSIGAWLSYAPPLYAEPRESIDILKAVSAAMHLNPNIKFAEESYNFASGAAQEQTGRFDIQTEASASVERNHTILTQEQREPFQRSAIPTDASTISAGVFKQTRYGQTVGIQAAVERVEDEFSNPTSPNRGTVRFTILQPLLRGRGTEVTTAAERRALDELQASSYELQRQVALSIGEGATAYWEYLAATKNVEILREAERRSEERHEEMKLLVKGDAAPATILEQSAAELFFRTAQRINAETFVYQARQILGYRMGIPYETFEKLGDPATDFPPVEQILSISPEKLEEFINEVHSERSDLIAARYRLDGARAFKKAAYNGQRPELNLHLSVGYSALEEGGVARDYFRGLTEDKEGPDFKAQIVYRFPIQNNAAEGVYAQALADFRRQTIQLQEMHRAAKAEIAVAISNLLGNITAYRQSTKATEQFEVALQNELKKFRAGLGSILDIQQVEEQLTEALLQEVQTRFGYAAALIDLRLATDMIYDRSGADAAVSLELLTTIPKGLRLQGK